MASKSKELTPDVKIVLVDLSNQVFQGKQISELLYIKPRTIQNFLKLDHEPWLSTNIEIKNCTRRDIRTLLRIVRSNRRSTLKDVPAKFNKRAIFNYSIRSIRRRHFDSGFKRRPVSKKITIGPFNRERRLRFFRSEINWSVENDWAKIIFSDNTRV